MKKQTKKVRKTVRVGHYLGFELLLNLESRPNAYPKEVLISMVENFISRAHHMNDIVAELKQILK